MIDQASLSCANFDFYMEIVFSCEKMLRDEIDDKFALIGKCAQEWGGERKHVDARAREGRVVLSKTD